MADDLADEVKVFRRKHAEDDETTAQSSQQLLEDKKDVALETELEARPTASENLLGAKGIFKPTALNSPSFGLMQQFSPNYAMFAMPFFMSNPAAAAAAYAQTAARMSPGGYMHMMPASPSFVQMNPMNMYHNLQMLTSPSSPIYAQMAGKAGQIPLAANMRGNPLNQMNNMRLPYNPMASMANTMAQQAGTPKRTMDDRRRPHIKKPLNAFMWYMKENRPKLMLEMNYKEKQSAELNKELGRRWHSLNKEEQQPYFDLAKKDREEHKEKYPTWSARENYAIHKKKKRKREKSEEVGDFKKCRARFGVLNQERWCKFCKRKKKCEYSMERSTSSTEPSIPEFGMKMELELDEGMDVIDDPEASESESDGDEIDDPALTQQACNEVALQQDAV